MEVPDNGKPEYLVDFKKFVQSKKGLMFSENKIFIKGTFKEKGSDKIVSGDNFWAHEVFKSGEKINAELIYKTYLEWFNYTLRPHEKERIFVSAEFGDEDEVEV